MCEHVTDLHLSSAERVYALEQWDAGQSFGVSKTFQRSISVVSPRRFLRMPDLSRGPDYDQRDTGDWEKRQ